MKTSFPFSGILNSVRGADGHINSFADGVDRFVVVERDPVRAPYDHPMLGTFEVFLVAQSLAGQYFDAFTLVTIRFVEHRKAPPRMRVELRIADYLP